jgi:hypothetical protein
MFAQTDRLRSLGTRARTRYRPLADLVGRRSRFARARQPGGPAAWSPTSACSPRDEQAVAAEAVPPRCSAGGRRARPCWIVIDEAHNVRSAEPDFDR